MRIKLICVSINKSIKGLVNFKRRPNNIMIPSLGLLILAALTDEEHEVILINDDFEEIDYNDHVDLVGISFITPTSLRAYAIADRFREKGVTVVFGGVHATALPEEAGKHCDSLVIGEADCIWPLLLEDFKKNNLQKIYRNKEFIDLNCIPVPRRDLLKKKHYVTKNIIQASRGCSFNCEFCSVSELFGSRVRYRSVDKVIEEVKTLDDQIIIFSDDNLASNIPYSRELFTRMIPLKRKWIGEASWTISEDSGLLDIMVRSGCKALLIGFETLNHQDNIKKILGERDIIPLYKEVIKKIHDKGIIIFGTFIFGFDNDDCDVFKNTLSFILKSNIEFVTLAPLIPYPGTPLHKRLIRECRVTETDWRNYIYDPPGICFTPLKITKEEIRDNLKMMYRKIYSPKRILFFVLRMLKRYRNLGTVIRLLIISLALRRRTCFEWSEPS